MIDRPNCPLCGKRILWIMRAAGCCLGPFKMRGRDRQVKGAGCATYDARRNTQPACLSYLALSRGTEGGS